MNKKTISHTSIGLNFAADHTGDITQAKTVVLYQSDGTIIVSAEELKLKRLELGYLSSFNLINLLINYIIDNHIDRVVVDRSLEQIRDIRPLLSALRHVSINLDTKIELIFNKTNQGGRRHWSGNSVEEFLELSGFRVNTRTKKGILTYTISSNNEQYDNFLSTNNMPTRQFRQLMVTTEHSEYRITGGIGSYVKECERLYGEQSAVLVIDNNRDIDYQKILENKWFCAQLLIGEERVLELDNSNYDMLSAVVYDSLTQILFYYPEISIVESQEILLDRVIDAKNAALLPNALKLVTVCHGASFHLAKAKKDMLELEQVHVAYREKRTIEDSDITIFPTRFLKDSYGKTGVKKLSADNKIIKRLPFDTTRLPKGASLESYENIIYVGKTSSIKGFDIFLETLINLSTQDKKIFNEIKRVTCIVTSTEIHETRILELLKKAQEIYDIELMSLQREDLLKYLSLSSKNSIALVTYPGDNHPTVILELLAIGHDFIALDCGGTPELIPDGLKDSFIVNNDINEICNKIAQNNRSLKDRRELLEWARKQYLAEQEKINTEYKLSFFDKFQLRAKNNTNKLAEIYVEIKGNIHSDNYSLTLESIQNQITNARVLIGRAPVRNKEAMYIRLEAGDILDGDALQLLSNTLLSNPEAAAVLANEKVSTYENYKYKNSELFSPVAPQLGSVFLQEKYKRRVVGLFKYDYLPEDSATLSDWELAIYVSSCAKRVHIVPELLFVLHRDDSSVDWDHQSSQERMSKVLFGLERFDSYVLYSQLKRLDDLYFGSKLYNHLAEMYVRRDDPTIIYNATPTTKRAIGAYRRYAPSYLHKLVMISLKITYRLAKKIQRLINK